MGKRWQITLLFLCLCIWGSRVVRNRSQRTHLKFCVGWQRHRSHHQIICPVSTVISGTLNLEKRDFFSLKISHLHRYNPVDRPFKLERGLVLLYRIFFISFSFCLTVFKLTIFRLVKLVKTLLTKALITVLHFKGGPPDLLLQGESDYITLALM